MLHLLSLFPNKPFSCLKKNEKILESFVPSRWVRQGDPLSPYVFVLCMERLSHAILQSVWEGKWKPISLGSNDPSISHLFFANDLMLFAEAYKEQVTMIEDVLLRFCDSSVQKISKQTFLVYLS